MKYGVERRALGASDLAITPVGVGTGPIGSSPGTWWVNWGPQDEGEAVRAIQAALAVAAEGFRELGIPFSLAVTLLEHAELTADETSLEEAREIFERLDARPWLARLDAAQAGAHTQIPA